MEQISGWCISRYLLVLTSSSGAKIPQYEIAQADESHADRKENPNEPLFDKN
jgi:hypothetical protein